MSTPYVGEIRLFSFPRVPVGWLACDGSAQSIADNQLLYTLLGIQYGGDGFATFNLPDLRGRIPMHNGSGAGLTPRVLGQTAGTETVTLTANQVPQHTHALMATTNQGTANIPATALILGSIPTDTPDLLYLTLPGTNPPRPQDLSPSMIQMTGSGQPHPNCMATLTMSYCIANVGVFPQRP